MPGMSGEGPERFFATQREWFARYLRILLEEAEPIVAENVHLVELLLMEAEVDAARRALEEAGPPRYEPGHPVFVRQVGTTCMSTSLANAMISMGETCFADDREERVHAFTMDVVENTSSFGKPGEYRSVDDLFKYLESGRLTEVSPGGGRFAGDFRVRLTSSLIDVVEALWTGVGRLVIQRSAHAHLAFGLEVDGDEVRVLFRDPMHATGTGCSRITLGALRTGYLWSPLKKIPRLMGPHGFPRLTAEELIGHLERYAEMENLGVDCPSALVYRVEDVPPLNSPPEEGDEGGEAAEGEEAEAEAEAEAAEAEARSSAGSE